MSNNRSICALNRHDVTITHSDDTLFDIGNISKRIISSFNTDATKMKYDKRTLTSTPAIPMRFSKRQFRRDWLHGFNLSQHCLPDAKKLRQHFLTYISLRYILTFFDVYQSTVHFNILMLKCTVDWYMFLYWCEI